MLKKIPLYCLYFLVFAANAQKPGDSLFADNKIHEINIVFTQTYFWDSLTLYKHISDSTGKDISMMAAVMIDGTAIDSIGVRLKGNSTYQHPGQKKPIRLEFNEYVKGQRYDGLRGIHLNNGAYDPTMLREKLYLDILNKHGLAAPRCAYTRVSFNGQYVGLYKIVEAIDKTFLKTHFKNNDRNLYKGDPLATLQWKGWSQSAYYVDYELKTNETKNDWSDLVGFINTVNNSGPAFEQNIAGALNTSSYIQTWAANNLFVNLDAYIYNAHNYYLFNDSIAGKFQWISWDVGVAFGVFPLWWQSKAENLDILYLPDPPSKLPLNKNLMAVDAYKQQYLEALCGFLYDDLHPAKIFPRIDSLSNMIRPYIYSEPDANQMYTEAQFEANLGYGAIKAWIFSDIPGLKDFIGSRWSNVSGQLCEKEWSCSLNKNIAGLDGGAINVYPNPSATRMTLQFMAPQYDREISIRITDLMGNRVQEETIVLSTGQSSKDIDISGLACGVYVLSTNESCPDVRKKIVVAR